MRVPDTLVLEHLRLALVTVVWLSIILAGVGGASPALTRLPSKLCIWMTKLGFYNLRQRSYSWTVRGVRFLPIPKSPTSVSAHGFRLRFQRDDFSAVVLTRGGAEAVACMIGRRAHFAKASTRNTLVESPDVL